MKLRWFNKSEKAETKNTNINEQSNNRLALKLKRMEVECYKVRLQKDIREYMDLENRYLKS